MFHSVEHKDFKISITTKYMDEYSYVGIEEADNVRVAILELMQKKRDIDQLLEDIKDIRKRIFEKKKEIGDRIIDLQKSFVELGNMIPKIKVKRERKPQKIIKKVEEKEVIDLDKLKEEFEKLRREFETF